LTGTHVSIEVVAVIKPGFRGLSTKSAIEDPNFRIENLASLGFECILYGCKTAEPVPISLAPVPVATNEVPTSLLLAPMRVKRGSDPVVSIVYTNPIMKLPENVDTPSGTESTPPKKLTAEKYTGLPITKLAVVLTQYLQPKLSGLAEIVNVSSDADELTTTTVKY
jgi:hypothetical protein